MPTILITVANRGIGLNLTRVFASNGWTVFACCRNPEVAVNLNTLAEGQDIRVFALDVSDFDAIDGLMAGQDELSQAVTRMIQQGHPLRAYDISGWFWQDIGTWEDLTFAREGIEVRGS